MIHVWCVISWTLSTNVLHTPVRCMHPFSKKRKILPPFVPYSCCFIHDIIIPNVCISGDDVLSDFGISFLCQFGSLNICCKVPTSLWLLVNVRTYVHYLYTCWVQSYLYVNNFSVYWTWLALSSDLPLEIIQCETLLPWYTWT